MTKEELGIGLICAGVIGTIGLVYCYGRTQYYQGRINARAELMKEYEKIHKEVDEKFWKEKIFSVSF